MIDSTRHTVGGKNSSVPAQEDDKSPGDRELVEIGPGKLVLRKVGGVENPDARQVEFDDLRIVGGELTLEEPDEPDHDPYNRYIMNRGDIWYRVRRKPVDSDPDQT